MDDLIIPVFYEIDNFCMHCYSLYGTTMHTNW